MSKTITLIVTALIISFSSKGQNLQTSNASGYIWGDTLLQDALVNITNTGPDTLWVKVEMDNSLCASGHITYFCWGITCYPPNIYVSPASIAIPPGGTNTSFKGYLNPDGNVGISQVTYLFYDKDDNADSVGITFTYDISIGIKELENTVSLSSPSPNPANNLASISYDLKSFRNAKLVISNILGKKVSEINLNERQQTLIIPTSHLTSGIYFCSIIADGKILTSKKLVVAHR